MKSVERGSLAAALQKLLTEHYPSPFRKSIPNKDKPHGEDVRIYDDSAVYLDVPSFNVKIAAIM